MRVMVLVAVVVAALASTNGNAAADAAQPIAPGVTYRTFDLAASHGAVHGHLLDVDLQNPHVAVDLLHPPAVAARAAVSQMAGAQGAVAGINGDFFNISEPASHAGVQPTGSSDGPEIAGGAELKGAVPDGQRFGPGLPSGTTTRDVLGVGVDRRARTGRLAVQGSVTTAAASLPVEGLNQYALPVDGVGAFTDAWGPASRQRATCGTDTNRDATCSTDTAEVWVEHGTVTSVAAMPGTTAIPAGTVALVGREQGADALRALHPGDHALVHYGLGGGPAVPFRFAVGGFAIVRAGHPLSGLDTATAAVRTGAGIGPGGTHLYLAVLDGTPDTSAGLTIAELASVLQSFGAVDAVNLDGGGSSTFVARQPGAGAVTVLNHPTAGAERPVANGVGVFTRP